MVCMQKTLPQADVGIFEKLPTSEELKLIAIQKEYEWESKIPNFSTSYQAPCFHDSGAGQWMTILKDEAQPWKNLKMNQRVLVTVHNWGIYGAYIRGGKPHSGVCGGIVTSDNGYRKVSQNYCTRTTKEQVLDFLKLNSKICEDDGGGQCKTL